MKTDFKLSDFDKVIDNFQTAIDGKIITNDKVYNFGGIKPFGYQNAILRELLKRPIKRGFLVLPRRAGKTFMMAFYLIWRCFKKCQEGTDAFALNYGIMYPELQEGKEACWDTLQLLARGLPNLKSNQTMGQIQFILPTKDSTGAERTVVCRIKIVGLKNAEHRRGAGFEGLVLDEKGTLPRGANKVVLPMIRDKKKKNTFLINVGTPNEVGEFWEDYDKYKAKEDEGDETVFTFKTDITKTKHIPQDDFELLTLDMSQEEIDIEYYCKRGVSTGARYFTKELDDARKQGRITKIPNVDERPKVLSLDLAASKKDLLSLWVVQFNRTIGRFEFVDYFETVDGRASKVKDFCQREKYNVSQLLLPWDGAVGMKPPAELFKEEFPHAIITVLPRDGRQAKASRIRRTRPMLAKSIFDEIKCVQGLNHLSRFSKKWDKSKKMYLIDPQHDIHSHAADAYGHFAHAHDAKLLDFSGGYDIYGIGNQKAAQPFDPLTDWEKPSYAGL